MAYFSLPFSICISVCLNVCTRASMKTLYLSVSVFGSRYVCMCNCNLLSCIMVLVLERKVSRVLIEIRKFSIPVGLRVQNQERT